MSTIKGSSATSRTVRLTTCGVMILAISTAVAACGGTGGATAASTTGTSKPAANSNAGAKYGLSSGTVKLNITATMPYVGKTTSGTLTGFDGVLFEDAMKKLDLKYKMVLTDFPGLLASVQSGRQDIGIGDIGWSASRAKSGLFTDPPYYIPIILALRPGFKADTVTQLEGKTVGTVQGFIFIPGIQALPHATLRTYPDTPTTLADLTAGRIDAAFLDPLAVLQYKKTHPNANFTTTPLTPPTAAQVKQHPKWVVFGPAMSGWYLNPKEKKFETALNKIIRADVKDGTVSRILKKYGVSNTTPFTKPPAQWLTIFAKQRHESDRAATWVPPSS